MGAKHRPEVSVLWVEWVQFVLCTAVLVWYNTVIGLSNPIVFRFHPVFLCSAACGSC